MTTKLEQARKLIDGYVIDRNTLESISVPATASMRDMNAIAAMHGLRLDADGAEVTLADQCYTYAVRDGQIETICG